MEVIGGAFGLLLFIAIVWVWFLFLIPSVMADGFNMRPLPPNDAPVTIQNHVTVYQRVGSATAPPINLTPFAAPQISIGRSNPLHKWIEEIDRICGYYNPLKRDNVKSQECLDAEAEYNQQWEK